MRWCIDLKLFLVRRCDDMYEKMWWSLREDAKISHIFYRFAPGRLKKWKWKKRKLSGKPAYQLLSVRIDMQIRWSGPLRRSENFKILHFTPFRTEKCLCQNGKKTQHLIYLTIFRFAKKAFHFTKDFVQKYKGKYSNFSFLAFFLKFFLREWF